MKFSQLLWLSMAAAAPMSGEAGLFGWGSEEKVEAESKEVPTPENNNTIRNIISKERRFVLYNSRKLSGECLDVCVPVPDSPTPVPVGKPPAPIPGGGGTPTNAPVLDCDSLTNLGDGFSEATGDGHYTGCYPPITRLQPQNLAGRDDSVAVFVGGSYTGEHAAEVEGQMVVLGDLVLNRNGPSNFVSVGLGSHVIPASGGDCIIVGGDLRAFRQTQVFNQDVGMSCDIVYRGVGQNEDNFKTNGDVKHDPGYDLTFYEQMKHVLLKKSKYWKTLPITGTVTELYTTTTFKCNSNGPIEVFNIDADDGADWSKITKATSYRFSPSCRDKTILVNVLGQGTVQLKAVAMYDWNNRKGYRSGGFSTCMTQNILWNFPDAARVNIGSGKTSEFHGSLLVTGTLHMTTSGHSGRAMVLGDVIHQGTGSEFHSYPYNPPVPLPDPEDVCVIPDNLDAAVPNYPTHNPTSLPTKAPTKAPTKEPTTTQQGNRCTAIPQNRLPRGSWATTNDQCEICEPPKAKTYWPCNKRPRICEGNCVLR